MSITVSLYHRTSYHYDRPVSLSPHIVRLRPAPHARTPIQSYHLNISPEEHFLNWQQDAFSNWQARLVFPELAERMDVEVRLTAEMIAINPFDYFLDESAMELPFAYPPALGPDLAPYRARPLPDPDFEAFFKKAPPPQGGTNDWLVQLNAYVQSNIAYSIRMEPGVLSPGETIRRAIGSCRDSSWLLVNLLRRFGYAARFVSGYLIQLTADQNPIDDGPAGPKEDFTDLHAWVEVYLPGAGWVGLDPTSGLFAGEGHIPLAATPAPSSAAPISGAHGPAEVTFDFDMKIERIAEPPRITRPLTPAQWAAIDRAGKAIDQSLIADDVRLTMGGEPTFVSATDRDSPEWTVAAVGPTKRHYADQLIRRLQARFAPNGIIQHGQGKWYPGESLPRWAFSLIWLGDGSPLWSDVGRIAEERSSKPATIEDAEKLSKALSQALELEEEFVQPVFEDPAPHLLQEALLPDDIEPGDPRLESSEDRRRLAPVFEHGLGNPKAFVLPLQLQQAQASQRRRYRWGSEHWSTRRGKLFLIPGDSPAGFRLPLASLRMAENEEIRSYVEPLAQQRGRGDRHFAGPPQKDGTRPSPAITLAAQEKRRSRRQAPPEPSWTENQELQTSWVPAGPIFSTHPHYARTALSVEPRNGALSVFLPPVESVDAWADLLAAVEEAAKETGLAVRLEGYEPPQEAGLNIIRVTPDPGVIEVNIHPASNWQQLAEITEALYEEARQIGLDTTSFQIDGRPTGSGGGNHIVLGGASPADSPILRRPDLLGSIIRYWQNHPSLSYLFSGLFIGPTSQSPRLDEGRHDALYEMEIAFKELDRQAFTPPWLVDRIFRNLLTDLTGNTHRAEICIDKLYSPDGPTGRLGLVEFRGFEMPPHWQMGMAQALVIRALIAWFWREPFRGELLPFGTKLHDRFLLPTPLWQDFQKVLSDLSNAHGFSFDPEWYRAQLDFRFPIAGQTMVGSTELTIRNAIEPWLVLGEEGAIGGTARYVDSSVERVEISLKDFDPNRHVLCCNGYAVPLSYTPEGKAYAGIRFRSWQPWKALHPTIAAHGPLSFVLYDPYNEVALGGATYHVTHPGGRAHEIRPINALEAEGRRLARFSSGAFWPDGAVPAHAGVHPAFPETLDLRRL